MGDKERTSLEDIVDSSRRGDESAARQLFDRFRDSVMGYCVTQMDGDRDKAKELTQEIFVKVFQNLGDLRDSSRFSPWLWSIARRTCMDKGKKKSRHRDLLEGFSVERDVMRSSSDKELWERRIECVRELLESVEDDELRQMVELKYTPPEHTTRDIAEKLDMPHGTVTIKLMRFRETIADELTEKLREIDVSLTRIYHKHSISTEQ